ncbi:SDR family oxidoreductase [Pseudoxanthomonas indica]|uniref:3-oxoacyl-[acyl-carrier protein] reductase n=1 Tax=Pseudoxanthomonas indica TaxID=428993 RepID=A0A1T5M022_9GAMM|nr:SDR family oxidoreductase [Pseudoxanthomonas indica]GGD42972.1 short-chain dehydrogenase [Pseudoxanthomonas indica]SKC81394.1 3-oxoacyl-[acyl-carrier protein] reductase [Pseudoxanthomonas indica]
MDLDLSHLHALVCGASEGIGRAAAHELALLGADVTVLARRKDKLDEVVAQLPRVHADQQHAALVADLADAAGLRAQVEASLATHAFQILINNSGGPPAGRAIAAEASAYLDAFQRHLLANQLLAQLLAPGMRAGGWGRIVNVISTSVKEPIANLGVSNTIRGAVASWAKTLSRELGGDGITVNNVLPGYTRTARLQQILADRTAATGKDEASISAAMLASVPAARFADASEVAAAIAFLASPAAGYINGVSLAVDGGRMQSI